MSGGDKTRQMRLEKARKDIQEEFGRQKAELTSSRDMSANRFVGKTESIEDTLKEKTYGLQKLEDFQGVRRELEEARARKAAMTNELEDDQAKKKKKKKKKKATLSFAIDDEEDDEAGGDESRKDKEDDEEPKAKKAKLSKNPNVDTSFLPDREREDQERKVREELRKEWVTKQAEMKAETIEITYSYWDGSGHREMVTCKKGDTIATFLSKCQQQFSELRSVSVDNLMYIKEDLIIPHHYTFYDFIVNKARGKSGPLFNFDVHDDVRMLADATVEKDESHAGKVVERSWYNRSRHHFPQSRWEVYDPEKDYGAYRIA